MLARYECPGDRPIRRALTVFQQPGGAIRWCADRMRARGHIDRAAAVGMDRLALGTVSLVGSRRAVLVSFGRRSVWSIVL